MGLTSDKALVHPLLIAADAAVAHSVLQLINGLDVLSPRRSVALSVDKFLLIRCPPLTGIVPRLRVRAQKVALAVPLTIDIVEGTCAVRALHSGNHCDHGEQKGEHFRLSCAETARLQTRG